MLGMSRESGGDLEALWTESRPSEARGARPDSSKLCCDPLPPITMNTKEGSYAKRFTAINFYA